MKTKVINLFGGPGCGKSTLACEIFVALKKAGKEVELVREYVKDWAWENRKINTFDQLYILGKQSKKESMLYGKVDYIITDSPILLSPFYMQYYQDKNYLTQPALDFYKHASLSGVEHKNYLLKRYKKYNPKGRYETEEQAKLIDAAIEEFLCLTSQDYKYVDIADSFKCNAIIGDNNV